jgi:hypothetical protein
VRADVIEREYTIARVADDDLASAYDARTHATLRQVREPHHSLEVGCSHGHENRATNASPLCDVCVVKKLHDFVT